MAKASRCQHVAELHHSRNVSAPSLSQTADVSDKVKRKSPGSDRECSWFAGIPIAGLESEEWRSERGFYKALGFAEQRAMATGRTSIENESGFILAGSREGNLSPIARTVRRLVPLCLLQSKRLRKEQRDREMEVAR